MVDVSTTRSDCALATISSGCAFPCQSNTKPVNVTGGVGDSGCDCHGGRNRVKWDVTEVSQNGPSGGLSSGGSALDISNKRDFLKTSAIEHFSFHFLGNLSDSNRVN